VGAKTAKNFTAKDLLSDIADTVSSVFDQIEWAEEEIDRALRRHPAAADAIYHGFTLLMPTHPRLSRELVYRAHCRELVDRIADGADTRPDTAAEVCCRASQEPDRAPELGGSRTLQPHVGHSLPRPAGLRRAGTLLASFQGRSASSSARWTSSSAGPLVPLNVRPGCEPVQPRRWHSAHARRLGPGHRPHVLPVPRQETLDGVPRVPQAAPDPVPDRETACRLRQLLAHKMAEVVDWCQANDVELVFTPSNASWLNWIVRHEVA
jgi:hypothetical protein